MLVLKNCTTFYASKNTQKRKKERKRKKEKKEVEKERKKCSSFPDFECITFGRKREERNFFP